MKKIGIITLYGNYNLGNKLQNYAVQTFFEEMGFECKTIPHQEMSSNSILQTLKLKMIKKIGIPQESAFKLRQFDMRKKVFNEFSEQYLKLDSPVNYFSLPKDLPSRYDYFVAGSDQIWHNWTKKTEELNFYFLKFANKNQRLSFSPSFGVSTISPKFEAVYKSGLLGFINITCREEQGVEIIKELTGQDATVLLDPTMLIDVNIWISIENKPLYLPKKYILVYALGENNIKLQKFVSEYAQKYKLNIVDIYDPHKRDLYLTSPNEFIYYIHHAQIVVTDSFHATVFSILFHTNFVVFDRTENRNGNMSSRLDTLLNRFSLKNRKYSGFLDVGEADFKNVEMVLKQERNRAKSFYRNTIKELDEIK